MKEFFDYVLQFGNLNDQQIELIKSKATETTIHKDEYLSEAGKIPRKVGFLLEGIFRFCYYNNQGVEITNYFVDENHFVTDYQNFESGMASSEYLQAVTDCRVILFSKKDWDELLSTIIGWDRIVSKIVQKCLLHKVETRSPLVSEDATTRYKTFIDKFPLLANRVPLAFIASYLGITQQSLSRIRKNIK